MANLYINHGDMVQMAFLIWFFQSFTSFHPLHVGVTEIVYNEKQQSLEITHKLFTDDLEKQVESRFKTSGLGLNTPRQSPEADKWLEQYLKAYFQISVNGKPMIMSYLGHEYEAEATWMYVEIKGIKPPRSLQVSSRFLVDLYSDQTNFVHLKVRDYKQSLRLDKSKSAQQIRLPKS